VFLFGDGSFGVSVSFCCFFLVFPFFFVFLFCFLGFSSIGNWDTHTRMFEQMRQHCWQLVSLEHDADLMLLVGQTAQLPVAWRMNQKHVILSRLIRRKRTTLRPCARVQNPKAYAILFQRRVSLAQVLQCLVVALKDETGLLDNFLNHAHEILAPNP